MTRLRIPESLSDEILPGDYEVLYVRPIAGEIQVARTKISLGLKDKPRWDTLQRQPGVRIECANCGGWYGVDDIPIDEVGGWRCPQCRGLLT